MSNRLGRIRRHLALAITATAGTGLLYLALDSDDTIWLISMATAYVALVLLAVTLALGPLNVLRRRPNPVSSDVRRDVGIWAGVFGLAHFGVGLFVHLRGRPWLYFMWESPGAHLLPFRYDIAGLANWTGLAGVFILVVLLVLSNDMSLRRLGSRRWKVLQRFNYLGALLVLVHGVAYQIIERRQMILIGLFAALLITTGALQALGYLAYRRTRRD